MPPEKIVVRVPFWQMLVTWALIIVSVPIFGALDHLSYRDEIMSLTTERQAFNEAVAKWTGAVDRIEQFEKDLHKTRELQAQAFGLMKEVYEDLDNIPQVGNARNVRRFYKLKAEIDSINLKLMRGVSE